jgi:hypothetical protein
VLDRAAVLFAFEQVGADACLQMAANSMERYAFGRPIGSSRRSPSSRMSMSPPNLPGPTPTMAPGRRGRRR